MSPPEPPQRDPEQLLGLKIERRDLLRLLAAGALGAAFPGCPGPKPRPKIPASKITGALHGQDVELGHRFRDGGFPSKEPRRTESLKVLVVGAGVAGLSAAWRLRRAGLREGVLVLDMAKEPGGNSRWGESKVTRYPWGAHYLRVPTAEHRSLETFLSDVGLIVGRDKQGRPDWKMSAVCPAPHERIFKSGLWKSGLRLGKKPAQKEFKRFDELVEGYAKFRDSAGRRAFAIPVELSSEEPKLRALDRISMEAWLDQQGFQDPHLRWYVNYACRDDYGCNLKTTSAWAGLHYFCARRTTDGVRDQILAWPEGNGRLVQLLRQAHGEPALRTGNVCLKVLPGKRGEASEAWVYDTTKRELVRYRAEHLIFAGPRFVLDRVLPEPSTPPGAFTYAPWLTVNLTLSETPGGAGAELAWDNVVYDSKSLGYVIANRQGKPYADCVVTYYFPFTGDDALAERKRLLAMDHEAIKDFCLEELYRVHPPLEGRVKAVDAWRWGHAMIRPLPGFMWGQRLQVLQREDALLCAHSDMSGISIFEEAFYRGVVAGEEVLRRRGASFDSIL